MFTSKNHEKHFSLVYSISADINELWSCHVIRRAFHTKNALACDNFLRKLYSCKQKQTNLEWSKDKFIDKNILMVFSTSRRVVYHTLKKISIVSNFD